MKMFRADTDEWTVVEVDCPDGLYPNNDSDGKQIFDNTHFTTESEAVRKLRAEAEAWLRLTTKTVERLRSEILIREKECVAAGLAVCKTIEIWNEKIL